MSQTVLAESQQAISFSPVNASAPYGSRRIVTQRSLGRVVIGLVAAFLAFDAAVKVLMLSMAVEGTVRLGYPESMILPLGIIQIAALAAYLYPPTAVVGALVWTGYLGGAVATHVRIGSPLFSATLFPIYVAALIWAGLALRDGRVAALFTGRRASTER